MGIKNIPCTVDEDKLKETIKTLGFGDYDRLYVPKKARRRKGKSGASIGHHAFISFPTLERTKSFTSCMAGYSFSSSTPEQVIAVLPAHFQGTDPSKMRKRKATGGAEHDHGSPDKSRSRCDEHLSHHELCNLDCRGNSRPCWLSAEECEIHWRRMCVPTNQHGYPVSIPIHVQGQSPHFHNYHDPIGSSNGVHVDSATSQVKRPMRKYTCRFHIGIENDEDFQVNRRIIGMHGINMKRIFQQTDAKLRLRGCGSGYLEADHGNKESSEPLQLCVSCTDVDGYQAALRQVELLLRRVYDEYSQFCREKGLEVRNLHINRTEDQRSSKSKRGKQTSG